MILDGNQYKAIVEFSPNLIWRAGTDGLCDYFNSTWLDFTGRTTEQEVGNGWVESVHPDDMEKCLSTYIQAFAKREAFVMIYRLRRFDGQWRWLNDHGVPFYSETDDFLGYIGSCMDITEQVNGELWRRMAQKDGLTGINNRQYFEQLARQKFDEAKRYKTELCALMIDIDNFKNINDRYGHQAGDKVIIAFARLFEENIRQMDILGRYGGDEFIIVLPNTTYQDAKGLISRLNDLTVKPFNIENVGSIKLSFSYGIGIFEDNDTFEALVSKADKEMYKCKSIKKGLTK